MRDGIASWDMVTTRSAGSGNRDLGRSLGPDAECLTLCGAFFFFLNASADHYAKFEETGNLFGN